MSNTHTAHIVRGIFIKDADVCDAYEQCRFPVDAHGTGEYDTDGAVIGTSAHCSLIHKLVDLPTTHDDLIVECATRVSGDRLFTKDDIALYVVRSLQ